MLEIIATILGFAVMSVAVAGFVTMVLDPKLTSRPANTAAIVVGLLTFGGLVWWWM